MEAYAIHKNDMIKPRLARMTMDLIRGKSVDEARAILETTNTKASTLIYKVLNSADYGVPQVRERVIIVGVRKDINFTFHYPEHTNSKEGNDGKPKWVSVEESIGNLPNPDEPNSLFNHTYSKYKLNFNGYIGHRPLDPQKPAPTVTARGDNKGGVMLKEVLMVVLQKKLSVGDNKGILC